VNTWELTQVSNYVEVAPKETKPQKPTKSLIGFSSNNFTLKDTEGKTVFACLSKTKRGRQSISYVDQKGRHGKLINGVFKTIGQINDEAYQQKQRVQQAKDLISSIQNTISWKRVSLDGNTLGLYENMGKVFDYYGIQKTNKTTSRHFETTRINGQKIQMIPDGVKIIAPLEIIS
jgi:uncharacterized protein (UPF0333 family)